jgi:hypothetical protein
MRGQWISLPGRPSSVLPLVVKWAGGLMVNLPENPVSSVEHKEEWSDIFRFIWVGLWQSKTRAAALQALWRSIRFFGKIFGGSLLFGLCLGILIAVGQSVSIGFYPAWKLYKTYWILSPLVGPALFALVVSPGAIIGALWYLLRRWIGDRTAEWTGAIFVILLLGGGAIALGYFGAREDNPMLNSQPANMDALSKSVGEQSRVLSKMSESGRALLDQLSATEVELESAKKQLTTTLANFDVQRQAAGQVTEELKQIDSRQKQIALQAEQLQRILEGQQPITRHDLQRANLQGQGSGFVIGFVASFLASMAYSAIGKKKSVRA